MRPFAPFVVLAFLALLANDAGAQCSEWKGGFGTPGVDNRVRASIVFDDGSGPALYIGGDFTSADGIPIAHVARWNGVAWNAVAGGLPDIVRCFAIYDDGSGPRLYAAMPADRGVWKLEGSNWIQVPGSENTDLGGILAMAVFDDGSGEQLYVAGFFDGVGGVDSPSIARWNGSNWSAVGTGLTGTGFGFQAIDLEVYDDGNGPELYCCGLLFDGIKRWDGVSWKSVGGGVNSDSASALAVYDDGNGPELYVTGSFTSAGGVPVTGIARWNGSAWSDVGGGLAGGTVGRMTVRDDGNGAKLYCTTKLPPSGSVGAYRIATWNGASWAVLPGAMTDPVLALTPFRDTHGFALFVGGGFSSVDGASFGRVARFDGSGWHRIGTEGSGICGFVNSLRVFDDGSGTKLYAAGRFTTAGNSRALSLARFDGASWATVDGATVLDDAYANSITALREFDDGSGPALYMSTAPFGGTLFKRWNGSTFSTVGGASNGLVSALEVFDDGTGDALYAGGEFTQIGGVPTKGIARWTGASWVAVGTGIGTGSAGVYALATHDDGTGAQLYAAGIFAPGNIARWNGTSWSAVGGGTNGRVLDLQVFDDGSGAQLYAAGQFTHAGSTTTTGIARWDGNVWHDVGGGVQLCEGAGCTPSVSALGVHDDGSGPALYACGQFLVAGATLARRIARWNGIAWSALDIGFDSGSPGSLATFDDGNGPALFVGGTFARAGEWPSSNIAKWASCGAPPGNGFCFGDGSLVTPCPCVAPNVVPSPSGAPDAGCANSFHLGGAKLMSSGDVANDVVSLHVADLPPSALCVFFSGTSANAAGIPVGDGVRCADGALVRFGTQNASAGVARYPFAAIGHVLPLSTVSGFVAGSGTSAHYQALYRNPTANFCSAGTVNITNGQQLVW